MSDEVANLRRRVRQLEVARQRWKGRCAAKQHEIRYLRVKARDLANSRDRWRRLASDDPAVAHDAHADSPAALPFSPTPSGGNGLGEA